MKESVNELDAKRDRLYAILDKLDSVAVAYSGGVDSTCLLAACLEVLGPGKVLAMTADSPTYPAGEKARAQRVAQQLGARLRMINTRELDDPRFASNPPDRCYYCKAELFEKIWAIAREEGLQNVVYGATQDDLGDHRPGMRAPGSAAPGRHCWKRVWINPMCGNCRGTWVCLHGTSQHWLALLHVATENFSRAGSSGGTVGKDTGQDGLATYRLSEGDEKHG